VGLQDLRAINPYVDEDAARQLLDMAVAIIVHANRVGQINRSMLEARGLLGPARACSGLLGLQPHAVGLQPHVAVAGLQPHVAGLQHLMTGLGCNPALPG
tara:strand:- start:94 stop:393 length:300 start_codon:yes stop_codon:yes gene_type:complete